LRIIAQIPGIMITLLGAQQERNNVGLAGDNLGDESNPEAIVILDTTVMRRIDDKTNITGNNEVILLIF
jgi:nanoRNase/pAp phosphatase (c-di-AMP/oligoRNAs hydrolase)